jgi:tripartite-type tricarboxylate transporter receptor subunit TctC
MTNRRTVLRHLAAGAAALAAPKIFAQDDKSPITILVGVGTTVDFTARLIAEQLREVLGRPVVVVPRLGAGGRIALGELRRAAPDGRTLMFSTSSPFAIYPHIYKKLDYDPANDFSFIGGLSWFDIGVAVAAQSGLGDLKQVLEWAKTKGKDAVYGSSPGQGSASHFVGIAISVASGVPMVPVPYKDGSTALLDITAGRLSVLITGTGAMVELHKTGKLKIVAVSGEQRSALIPDVPTLTEMGVNTTLQISAGLYGPPKMPRELMERIYAAMLPMVSKPDIRAKMIAQSMTPAPMPGPRLAAWLAEERKRFDGLVRAAGVEKEDA